MCRSTTWHGDTPYTFRSMRCVQRQPMNAQRGFIGHAGLCCTLLAAVLLHLAIAPVTSAAPAPYSDGNRPQAVIAASAGLAVDLTTGVELFAQNADQPLPPASTIKLVTALVALEMLDQNARATVNPDEVLDGEQYSVMGLLPGDELSVRDLLYGLLLPSGGDAALVLARIGGAKLDPQTTDAVGRFVEEMNRWALRHGLTNSHFVNPTGDDAENQHASARDLARVAALVLDNWLLSRIVATKETTVEIAGPNARVLTIVNTNQLLGSPDVYGFKTGTDELARQCLVAGFWRGDNRIVTVVLGSEDRYADTQALLDDVDGRYRWVALGIGASSLGAN
ncbi:MAG: peptidase S11 [Chloroflexi bacterium]|nr:MAG: peptidase S11 [Chloroflexota bacterium]